MKKSHRVERWWSGAIGAAAILMLTPLFGFAAAPQPSDVEIQRQLEGVYGRPEFDPKPKTTFVQWLLTKLESAFRWLGTLYEKAPGLYWVLLISCLLLLGLLVGHIVWTVRRALFLGTTGKVDEAIRSERVRLSGAHRAEALLRAERGEYTEAIRYLFLSLVYFFDESGRVSFQRAYTNREYLRLFADRPEVHDQLRVFIDTLDRDWYGEHPTAREQYEDCLALYESLR
jgi:hypothetical protein